MNTVSTPAVGPQVPVADRVVAEAKRAWEVHGEPVQVSVTPVNGHAHMSSLAVLRARRVEYVVEADDADVWDVLAAARHSDEWQLSALVPLALMGRAHERLCEYGFELQGWWVQGDRVAFGGIEIA